MWQKEQVIRELKRRGKRMTKQRLLLLDIILDGRYSCGKEIYYDAIKVDPTIGLATVYRMLATLEEIGICNPTEEQIMAVAKAACAEGESIYNMPMEITPEKVYAAILSADAMGHFYRGE